LIKYLIVVISLLGMLTDLTQALQTPESVEIEDAYGKMKGGGGSPKGGGGSPKGKGKQAKQPKPKKQHPKKPKGKAKKPKKPVKKPTKAKKPVKAKSPAKVGASTCSYTVKSGDTLSAIGSRLGISYQTLASENGISNPNLIRVGQVLHYSCGGSSPAPPPPPSGGSSSQRQQLVTCGQALYNNRYSEHYTENSPARWTGIDDKIRPPSAPTYSDCSSAVTWCYWTVFGNGPDIINGENWQAGYTGTMATHGKAIDCSQLQPGDVILYGSGAPWDHAEMYMGNGQTVSHGADPVSYESSSSNQGFATHQCRSYF